MHIKNFIVKKTHMNTAPKKPYTVQSPEMIIFMYQHNYTNFDIFFSEMVTSLIIHQHALVALNMYGS